MGINTSKDMMVVMRIADLKKPNCLPDCASEPRHGITSNNGPGSMDAMVRFGRPVPFDDDWLWRDCDPLRSFHASND
jgi:hypothetical protein